MQRGGHHVYFSVSGLMIRLQKVRDLDGLTGNYIEIIEKIIGGATIHLFVDDGEYQHYRRAVPRLGEF